MKLAPPNAPQPEPFGIHWFRRDLRVAGNPALQWNWKQHGGRVVGLFAFDPKFLARPDFSPNRFAFFLETLRALRAELQSVGSDLLVLDRGPAEAFAELLTALGRSRKLPAAVSFNRDYEPFARERDLAITQLLEEKHKIQIHTERDHLLIEPHEILKDNHGATYQIYSPFAKRWFERLNNSDVRSRLEVQKRGLEYLRDRAGGKSHAGLFRLSWSDLIDTASLPADHLEPYLAANSKLVSVPIPKAGSLAAYETLNAFKGSRLEKYAEARDFPEIAGTSHLSIYLKNGSITSAQVIAALDLQDETFATKNGSSVYLKEIVWREFYYYILFHHPRVEHEAFLTKFKNLDWENREDYFEAWKSGNTGFPIVDAGMRQLNSTGWMHNRVRMIVASFLTKDLLISWQWGERYFMEKLLDGDLAPNNGGWQWAASTGCDPQPYFRIFNPLLQSQKFDSEGNYIRKYIPELRALDGEEIHAPLSAGSRVSYPRPIVDHQEQKEKALELYDVESKA